MADQVQFEIKLKENASAGFTIAHVPNNSIFPVFISKTREISNVNPNMCGSPTDVIFTFRAPKGKYQIAFVKSRSWEKDTSQTFTVDVDV
jgi:hypothetical protein